MVLPLSTMKKLPIELKAKRLSTSIPAELNDWMEHELYRLALTSPLGDRPPLASLVAHALYEYKAKADQRAKQDMEHAGKEMSQAAKKVSTKKK
jgi:hypothetical protein